MREIYLLIVVILFTCCFSYSQSVKKNSDSQLNRRGLNGRVKSLVSKTFPAIEKSGNIFKGKRFYSEDDDSLSFDINGNLLKAYNVDFEGNLQSSAFFDYDNMSYRIEEKIYDGKGKLINHTTNKNKYDKNGNIIEITSISTGDAIVNNFKTNKINYKYDDKGNRVEMIFSDSMGVEKSKYVYKYNENSKVAEESVVYATGKLICNDKYEYDKNGNRNLWDHFYSDGRLVSRIKEVYDDDNNLIDNEIYSLIDGKLSLDSKSKCNYDNNKSKIEETSYNSNGDKVSNESYRYKYDNQKNWIECIEFENGKPIKISERKIEYF